MYPVKPNIRAPFLGMQTKNQHSSVPTVKRSYTSSELFGEQAEITILHAGQHYQLRITSLGKLILTK